MIWKKGAHQSAKFQNFGCFSKISTKLCFDRLLLLKLYKIPAKKVQKSDVSWSWRVMQNLKIVWFVVSKMTRIWWILTRVLESLKISTLIGSFCAKYLMFDLKKVQRSQYFMTLKRDAKFKEKLTCGLESDMRNLANFYQSTQKCQNWDFDGILLSKIENVWA